MKGGSPLFTMKSFVAPALSIEIVQEWGECFWTAHDLCVAEFQRRLSDRSVRALVLGHT